MKLRGGYKRVSIKTIIHSSDIQNVMKLHGLKTVKEGEAALRKILSCAMDGEISELSADVRKAEL